MTSWQPRLTHHSSAERIPESSQNGQGYDSPTSTRQKPEGPPLQASLSPVTRIPFMTTSHPSSPSHHEMSLDTWGMGQGGSGGQEGAEGWESEAEWWTEDSAAVEL